MSTIAERFRTAAETYRERPAIVVDGVTTTYGELLAESLRVASLLVDRGIGHGDRVGVCMEKGARTVAVMLGTMLAGAACVPLELSMAPLRLVAIMTNASVGALFVTHSGRLPLPELRSIASVRTIVFDGGEPSDKVAGIEETWEEMPRAAFTRVARAYEASDPAYILFTSGSSGEPKGVVLSHEAALAFVDWASEAVALTAEDRVASHAALGFDLTVFDLYATLLRGAALYPVPEMQRGVAPFLGRFIESSAITVWYSVPSAAAKIADARAKHGAGLPSVRHLIVAGEVFPTRALAALRNAFPNATIHNWYGPTETNVVTHHEVGDTDDGSEPMPIGRACPFAKMRVLDEDLQDALPGARGILYAGGRSLMSGYWADDEKTRRSTISLDGERYYRTGDAATVDTGGTYHFVGRADDMVKIQGYRVEPAEVECALRDAAGTEDAAVIATDEGGETILVGFVACAVVTDAMRHALRQRLPGYMLPRTVVAVPSLPRNDRGKVDRHALARMRPSPP